MKIPVFISEKLPLDASSKVFFTGSGLFRLNSQSSCFKQVIFTGSNAFGLDYQSSALAQQKNGLVPPLVSASQVFTFPQAIKL